MTVTTVYAGTGDGYITSGDNTTTYSNARNGTGFTFSANTGGTEVVVGQRSLSNLYYCYEAFLAFDLSGIADGDTPSAVELALDGYSDASTNDDTFEVHEQAFGTLTTADWQTGDAYNAATPLATWNTSGYVGGYNAFTSDSSFLAALDFTATLELILIASKQVDNSAPTTSEYVQFSSADVSGTTSDPKLTVTHATPPALLPRMSLMGVG